MIENRQQQIEQAQILNQKDPMKRNSTSKKQKKANKKNLEPTIKINENTITEEFLAKQNNVSAFTKDSKKSNGVVFTRPKFSHTPLPVNQMRKMMSNKQ